MNRFSVERSGNRAVITFDDRGMNLLSSDSLSELKTVIESVRDARVVSFTSGRAGLFAAGADMSEMLRFSPLEAEAFAVLGQELFAAIEEVPAITVAWIDGDCFGGALDLAMAFDLRLATERSRFSHPGSRIGIVTGFGGTSRWRKLLDRAAARKLFLGNDVLTAAEAETIGLIDRIGLSLDQETERLAALDLRTTRFLKELAPRAERLGRYDLDLISRRLWELHGMQR